MRRTNFLGLCFSVIAFALMLQGCGGGSSKSKPIAPTDSSAATSASANTSSQASSNPSQTTKLTLSGLVVADALAGADIEITVGTQRFTTKADAQKHYQLELIVNDENLNVPFFAKATGVNTNQWVQLAALFPSVGALKNLAGSDGILDSNEYFGVNISSFTTAEFVLAREINSELNNDEDRKAALLSISTLRQMEIAGMIMAFMTTTDFHLPSNTATTLDFALDSNITMTYIRVLKESNPALVNEAIANIKSDEQRLNISSQLTKGQYLIESTNFTYLIDLNEDGTGRLQTGNIPVNQIWINSDGIKYVDSPLTWVKTGKSIKINFENPIAYGKVTEIPNPEIINGVVPCSQPINNQLQLCDVTLNSIELTLITENEFRKILDISVAVEMRDQNGVSVYDNANTLYLAAMTERTAFHKVIDANIEGFEWYTNTYRYVFSSDGTASQIDMKTKQEKNIDWKIQNDHLVLDAGSIDLWLRYSIEGGFFVTQMERIQKQDNQFAALSSSYMVKRQPVNMVNADWVGRWTDVMLNSEADSYDVYDNGRWRDGFETESEGSWSALGPNKQTALSNGSWRMIRDVLAIYNGQYHIQYCGGLEQPEFVPIFCGIEIVSKDSSFTGNVYWASWSHPLFQDIETGRAWSFTQNNLYLSYTEYWTAKSFTKIAANKLYFAATRKILEMISSTANTIDVCEYDAFADCSTGTLYKLERGIEVKVASSIYEGYLNYEYQLADGGSFSAWFKKVYMMPKNRPFTFTIFPQPSYEVNSVNGCGGTLSGNKYYASAQTSDCELSASFKPVTN
ncbi:MAG: hypothetical protein V4660_00425 [Pseudomonadota bacterium]